MWSHGDGHPDHEAVGRAAASACAHTGSTLLEYPVWMWHWATPADPDVPWDRAHLVRVSCRAVDRKRLAAQCFRSQREPIGTAAAPLTKRCPGLGSRDRIEWWSSTKNPIWLPPGMPAETEGARLV